MIRITYGALNTEIQNFASEDTPRTQPDTPAVNFTAAGTATTEGTSYEPPFLFEIDAYITYEQKAAIKRLWAKWERNRADKLTVEDYCDLYVEESPRTRALATGATANTTDGMVDYHAKFYAVPVSAPTFKNLELVVQVSWTLQEVEVFAP